MLQTPPVLTCSTRSEMKLVVSRRRALLLQLLRFSGKFCLCLILAFDFLCFLAFDRTRW